MAQITILVAGKTVGQPRPFGQGMTFIGARSFVRQLNRAAERAGAVERVSVQVDFPESGGRTTISAPEFLARLVDALARPEHDRLDVLNLASFAPARQV